jgi:hypothetical protein
MADQATAQTVHDVLLQACRIAADDPAGLHASPELDALLIVTALGRDALCHDVFKFSLGEAIQRLTTGQRALCAEVQSALCRAQSDAIMRDFTQTQTEQARRNPARRR